MITGWPCGLRGMSNVPLIENSARPRGRTLAPSPASHNEPGDLDELLGALVAIVTVEEAAAAEVLAGERVGRGDRVPGGSAAAQVIEGGELPGELERLVERGVQRGGQTDPIGHGRRARRAR